jgi:hypothetical protein
VFKRLKEMKGVIAETPDLIRNAQAMQANAAQMGQTAPTMPAAPAPIPAGVAPGDGPIAGVDLALYASISRTMADRGLGPSAAPSVAAEHGIDGSSWDAAVAGWNARMQSDHQLAKRFNAHYRGVG